MEPSEQKRHVRQALADLIFGLALFAIFVLLGVFGVREASSGEQRWPSDITQVGSTPATQINPIGEFLEEPVSPAAGR